uniref:Uncharacterized protein n=1 Tax=Rhizophora mucronata TaxID=61149 RepID=A0A2P2QG21_RHIMU
MILFLSSRSFTNVTF